MTDEQERNGLNFAHNATCTKVKYGLWGASKIICSLSISCWRASWLFRSSKLSLVDEPEDAVENIVLEDSLPVEDLVVSSISSLGVVVSNLSRRMLPFYSRPLLSSVPFPRFPQLVIIFYQYFMYDKKYSVIRLLRLKVRPSRLKLTLL